MTKRIFKLLVNVELYDRICRSLNTGIIPQVIVISITRMLDVHTKYFLHVYQVKNLSYWE